MFAFVATMCCTRVHAVAQPVPQEHVQGWVDGRSALGAQVGNKFAVEANWKVNLRIPLDPSTTEALARDLSEFPDHPLRGRQQKMRDAAEKGIETARYLAAADNLWRIAKDEAGPDGTRWHSGGSGDDAWMWYQTEVTVVHAERPPHGRDYPDLRFEYLVDILDFTTGGLADLPPRTRTWRVTEHSGSSWKAVAHVGEPPVQYTAVGSWDPGAGRGTVLAVTSDTSRTEYSEWRERSGFWTAGVVKQSTNDGYRRTATLIDIGTPPREKVAALARTPTPGTPDALLTEAPPMTLVDLRGTVPSAIRHTPEGMIQLDLQETPQSAARRMFRWAGWAIGGSLTALLGAAVWWRVRRGST
ncbi:MAG: hypothetical protein SFY69_03285 [Planctomycetota bacterium]|nr:hypothetical protein [Planctomycetota bacterium]